MDEQQSVDEKLVEEIKEEVKIEQSKFDWVRLILPGAIVLAGILISASVLYTSGGFANIRNLAAPSAPGVKVNVSADDDAFLGKSNAPVVVIEFSDYQCPFCRTFWRDALPLIKSEYIDTGKVKFVYRDFPLQFHSGAMPAAQASECAEDQGKFWDMHDKVFGEQDKQGQGTIQFGLEDLKKWAKEIGLNSQEFNSCLDSQKYSEEVDKDLNDGQAVGVNGTPTTFINGKAVVGAQPFSVFKAAIDEALNK